MVSPIFPRQGGFGTPPDHGQRQGADAAERDNNRGCSEIPGKLFFCKTRGFGTIQKLTTVLALYGGVLDFFSAKRAYFHFQLS